MGGRGSNRFSSYNYSSRGACLLSDGLGLGLGLERYGDVVTHIWGALNPARKHKYFFIHKNCKSYSDEHSHQDFFFKVSCRHITKENNCVHACWQRRYWAGSQLRSEEGCQAQPAKGKRNPCKSFWHNRFWTTGLTNTPPYTNFR